MTTKWAKTLWQMCSNARLGPSKRGKSASQTSLRVCDMSAAQMSCCSSFYSLLPFPCQLNAYTHMRGGSVL